MPKLTVNGKSVEVDKGSNLLEAAKKAGFAVPHFCYHAGLSVAGNCRMCLVEIEGMPKLQIACATAPADNMVVLTDSPKVVKARQGVMEFLLLNHPIDCPVCDCSGECYLQDYYMQYDLKPSRLAVQKNKKEKALEIGPHVMLDRERCVLCSRCVRFTDEVSNTHELGIFGRGSTEEVGLREGAYLDNPYTGNLVDICPVGALTDKQFRFQSRTWYLKDVDTVCPGCARGCNVVLNTNTNPYNKVGNARAFRVYPRPNLDVNRYWMCDEGRYSYPAIDFGRLESPLAKGQAVSLDAGLGLLADGLRAALANNASTVAFLLSPQLTHEELWAWKWLADKLGVKQVEYGEEIKKTGFSDDILIHGDKNPNTLGAKNLGLGARSGVMGAKELLRSAEAGKISALVVVEQNLEGVMGAPALKGLAAQVDFLAFFNAHHSLSTALASVALPRAVYAEQEGTFTNCDGRVQINAKALEPMGLSLSAWEGAARLASMLGLEFPAGSAREIFAGVCLEVAAYKGMSYETLGACGQGTPKAGGA